MENIENLESNSIPSINSSVGKFDYINVFRTSTTSLLQLFNKSRLSYLTDGKKPAYGKVAEFF